MFTVPPGRKPGRRRGGQREEALSAGGVCTERGRRRVAGAVGGWGCSPSIAEGTYGFQGQLLLGGPGVRVSNACDWYRDGSLNRAGHQSRRSRAEGDAAGA